MSRWNPTGRSAIPQRRPSPWRLKAEELVREILATARDLAAARSHDDEPVWPPDAVWDLLIVVEASTAVRSIAELAIALRISRQAAHELVTRAARDGVVDLGTHPRDGRRIVVELTPRGAAALADLRRRQASRVIELLSNLSIREIEPVLRVLAIIRYRLDREARWHERSRRRPRLRPR